jgi:hypothetical protein
VMNTFLTCSDNVTDAYLEVILHSYNKFNNDYPLHEMCGRNGKSLVAIIASTKATSAVGRM